MTDDYRGAVLLVAQKCFNDYQRFHRGQELEKYFEDWIEMTLSRPSEEFVKEIWKEFLGLMIENGK